MRRSALSLVGVLAASGSGGCSVAATGMMDASGDTGALDAASDIGALDAASDASTADAGCSDPAVPPSTLECTGLYADFATKELAANALPYTPVTPLWSDGAQKARWIVLPPDSKIDISNPNEWVFPIGTKLFKEFRVGGKRVETRMFEKTKSNFWVYATYAWNSDDSQTTINYGGPVPAGNDGGTWTIPTNDECNDCHRGRQDRILGFEEVSLGLPGAQGLTLSQLAEMNLVTPAPANTSLTMGDDGTGLNSLAMGWIHVNCGVTCHNSNPSAAGYGAGMLLRLDPARLDGSPPSATTWDFLRTTIGVPCISGSVAGQPRIVPHDAKSSVLYQLIDERGTLQMPPIASQVVDTTDVAVVAAWIQALPAMDAGVPVGKDGGLGDAGPDDGGPPLQEAGRPDAGSADSGLSDSATTDGNTDAGDATISDGGALGAALDGASDAMFGQDSTDDVSAADSANADTDAGAE